jgi:hypothetical protein
LDDRICLLFDCISPLRFLTKFRVGHVKHSDLLDLLRLHSKYQLIEKYMELSGMQVNIHHIIELFSLYYIFAFAKVLLTTYVNDTMISSLIGNKCGRLFLLGVELLLFVDVVICYLQLPDIVVHKRRRTLLNTVFKTLFN